LRWLRLRKEGREVIESLLNELKHLRRKYKRIERNLIFLAESYKIDVDLERLEIVSSSRLRKKDKNRGV